MPLGPMAYAPPPGRSAANDKARSPDTRGSGLLTRTKRCPRSELDTQLEQERMWGEAAPFQVRAMLNSRKTVTLHEIESAPAQPSGIERGRTGR